MTELTSIQTPNATRRTKPLDRPLTRGWENCERGQVVRINGSVARLLSTPEAHGVVAGRETLIASVWLIGAARESTVVAESRAAALVLEG